MDEKFFSKMCKKSGTNVIKLVLSVISLSRQPVGQEWDKGNG